MSSIKIRSTHQASIKETGMYMIVTFEEGPYTGKKIRIGKGVAPVNQKRLVREAIRRLRKG